MTLALVGGSGQKETVYFLLKLLKEKGIDSYGILIGKRWETATAELVERLKKAGPIVIIPETSADSNSWFPFLVGYCSGMEDRGYFYIQNPMPFKNALFDVFLNFRNFDEIIEFFHREKDVWGKKEREKKARHSLIESGFGLTKENFAACVVDGNLEAAQNFLNFGFSPDTENEKGVPLLILAIRNKHRDIAIELISHGADVNRVSTDRGNTALMDAASAGELPLVAALIEAGADADMQSKNGQTALMLAAGENQKDAVRELLLRGAQTDLKDNLGMTAVKYAELFKHTGIIEMISRTHKE